MPKPKNICCLCSLHYERIGNNPAPLAQKGRCCDACNEIVIEARVNLKRFVEELTCVEHAIMRKLGDPRAMALAAICASRGPGLWAAHKRMLEQVRLQYAAHAPDGGSEPPTPSQ